MVIFFSYKYYFAMRGGEIKKISDLFERYKKTLIAPERAVIDCFVEVVDELFGITVSPNLVSYTPSTRTLTIKSSVLRNEVKLHQREILAHIKGRLGPKNAPHTII